eukprot:TRINITY_DN3192_c0_g1_i1.p1 TRINITY_DN3192_c0_g1~~TRINITY_DN3192_c0_g1_i1.p1  ORF type:complete len:124 (-),score=14.36 TRINITY_DN3192_c0_g1_i1:46-417(-)
METQSDIHKTEEKIQTKKCLRDLAILVSQEGKSNRRPKSEFDIIVQSLIQIEELEQEVTSLTNSINKIRSRTSGVEKFFEDHLMDLVFWGLDSSEVSCFQEPELSLVDCENPDNLEDDCDLKP